MKEKRKIVALTTLAIVLAIAVMWAISSRLVQQDGEPPVEGAITTFENFLEAFNKQDIERMWDLLSVDQRGRVSFENFLKVVKKPGDVVAGQEIGVLELEEAIVESVSGEKATLVVRIVEHRKVLEVLGDPEDPEAYHWENRHLVGTGEIKLKFEEGAWKIDMLVVANPDPNEPIRALELEVKAEPIEVKVGDGITLNFTIRSGSPLPIVIYHAHTPARVILYKGENRIAQFPQVILSTELWQILNLSPR